MENNVCQAGALSPSTDPFYELFLPTARGPKALSAEILSIEFQPGVFPMSIHPGPVALVPSLQQPSPAVAPGAQKVVALPTPHAPFDWSI
jgi:hypothetical protein